MESRFHKIFLVTAMVFTALACSVKEDMSDCFPEESTEGKIILDFKCINQNYLIPDIIRDLELLFYNGDGVLVHNLNYDRAELEQMKWQVPLSEESGPEKGKYKILALVNYVFESHLSVSGKDNLDEFLAVLNRDSERWVKYFLSDTYQGISDLDIAYIPNDEIYHTINLSKNTNTIKLTVEFDDERTVGRLDSYRSYLTGNNGDYRWDELVPEVYWTRNTGDVTRAENEIVLYVPYESSFGDGDPVIVDLIKTMRVSTDSDLKLIMEFMENGIFYSEEINIPQMLAKVEKNGIKIYDTDEKLEQYDFFDITVRIGSEFVAVSLIIDGWYLVISGVDV